MIKLLLLLITLLFSSPAFADLASGTFTPPTTRTNGALLPQSEIGWYVVYLDGVPVPENDGGILPPDATTFAVTILKPQTLTIRTFDTNARSSKDSIPITIAPLDKTAPNSPTDVTVTVTINIK